MYGFLWRHLPGNRWVRAVTSTVLLVAVLALLFLVVFPYVEPRLPYNRVTVDNAPSPTPSVSSPAVPG